MNDKKKSASSEFEGMSGDNQKDIQEIKEDYTKDLKFHYVNSMTEVLDLALLSQKVKPSKTTKK